MRRSFHFIQVSVFFLVYALSTFSTDASDLIVLYRLKGGKEKEICSDFTPGTKIYADFTFLPEERETHVEFRWINPLNKKEQVYSEVIKSAMPFRKQTVLCWLYLPSSLPDRIIGSKYFGRWLLEVWVNQRRVAVKAFQVGN